MDALYSSLFLFYIFSSIPISEWNCTKDYRLLGCYLGFIFLIVEFCSFISLERVGAVFLIW